MTRAKTILEKIQNEGINDRGIFKAIIMAGGPGSGKSFITDGIIGKTGPVSGLGASIVNSDQFFERGLAKLGLSSKLDPSDTETFAKQMQARSLAKTVTQTKLGNVLNGMLPLVLDGTGRDFKKIKAQKEALQSLGYDVDMVFVNTSLKVALERNAARSRTVPEDIVTKAWQDVQDNIGKFQSLFGGSNFHVIDNSKTLDKEEIASLKDDLFKQGKKIFEQPISNPYGKMLKKALEKSGGKLLSDLETAPKSKVKV